MGFAQVSVTNPDGGTETHKFYSTEGWGLYSASQVQCLENPPNPCHDDPWWDTNHTAAGQSNALHGREYELDRKASNGALLEQVNTQYAAVCPPAGVSGSVSGQLVSSLDPGNPVAVCDPQTRQVDDYTYDGAGGTVPYKTTIYTYETGSSTCTTCYGRVTSVKTISSNGSANGNPTTIVKASAYTWNDAVSASVTAVNGPYLINFPAFTGTEDSTGAQYQCAYTNYDGAANFIGQTSSLGFGNISQMSRYMNCGTSLATATGQIPTQYWYDAFGNQVAMRSPNRITSLPPRNGWAGCTVPSQGTALFSSCWSFDGTFDALPTASADYYNHTTQTTYQAPATSTAAGGFGLWPMSSVDPNNQATSFTYDALARSINTSLPGEASTFTSSAAYTVWCATGAQSPCAEVDQTQRLNSTTTVTSRAFYDGLGHLVETRSPAPSGDIVQYGYYDPSQRLVFKSVPYLVTAYSGSPGSAAYSIPDSTVAGTSYAYDALGRQTSLTDPLSEASSSAFSVVCNPVTGDTSCYEQTMSTDPLGHEAGVIIDAIGRTNYEQRYSGNSPATYSLYATTKYTYDYLGELTQLLQPDGTSKNLNQYDMAGRQITMSDPDLGSFTTSGNCPTPTGEPALPATASECFAYDTDGNLTQSVDARTTSGGVLIGYDYVDRPISRASVSSPSSPYDTFTYDGGTNGIGHLTSETFKNSPDNTLIGGSAYAYDVRGQQLSSTLTLGATTYSPLQSNYDDAGNVLTQTYPDLETVTYSRGAQGWVSGVSTSKNSTTLLTGISYTGTGGAYGQMTLAHTDPAGTFNFGYDLLGRLNSITDQGGATFLGEQLSFDAAGNVSSINTSLSGATDNQAFCYDDQNRLTWAASTGTRPCPPGTPITTGSIPTYSQTFAYDNLGRLTSGPLGAYSYGASTHLHAATAIGSTYTAAYDSSGNMTCRAPSSTTTCSGAQTGAQLTYNLDGQLSAWQDKPNPANSTASFLYDGQGNRVEQVVTQGGSTTTNVYFGDVEEDATSGGTTTKTSYYYANGRRVAMAVGSVFSYIATDALGNSTVTVAKAAPYNVTATVLYAPYGSVRYSSGSMPTDHGFTGQIADPTSGLDYYGARYYDPVAGQFVKADNVLPGHGRDIWGLSRYAYVEGNPVNRIDPTGHSPCEDKGICNSHDSYQVRTGAPCNTCEGGLFWNYIPLSYKIVRQFRTLTSQEQQGQYAAIFGAILGGTVSVGGIGPVLKGQAGEQMVNAELESEGLTVIASQVTIDTSAGTTRPDTIAIDGDGNIYVFDAKNGPGAGPTQNQRLAFPKLESEGGTPRGRGAERQLGTRIGWTPGQRIYPVRVEYRYVNTNGDSSFSSEPGDESPAPDDLSLDQNEEK